MGCPHYHTPLDIVAIKFKCCGRYFPCYLCHEAQANHTAQKWWPEEFATQAILCRRCNSECTIQEYLECGFHCVRCKAPFNPGCASHWHLYFEL